jgi:hypothetical protein
MGRKTISEQFESVGALGKLLLLCYYIVGMSAAVAFAFWLGRIVDPYSAIIAKWIASLFAG